MIPAIYVDRPQFETHQRKHDERPACLLPLAHLRQISDEWNHNTEETKQADEYPDWRVQPNFGHEMKDLGNLGKTSHAYKINSRGQIVGGSRINDAGEIHAFLWENGGPMIDLNALIPSGSPLQLTLGFSMNDRGEIGSKFGTRPISATIGYPP